MLTPWDGSALPITRQGAPANPKASDAAYKATMKCLQSFGVIVGIQGIDVLLAVINNFKQYLILQITLLSISTKFLDGPLGTAQKYLASAQQTLNQARAFKDKLPLTAVQGCPPLKTISDRASDLISGPVTFTNPLNPATSVAVDVDGLIQDMQETLSIQVEMNLIKQILIDKVNELDVISSSLQAVKDNLSINV